MEPPQGSSRGRESIITAELKGLVFVETEEQIKVDGVAGVTGVISSSDLLNKPEFKEMMLPIQVDGSILILVLGAIQEVKILIPIIHRWPYQQNLVYIVMMSTQHYMNNGGKPVRHYLMLDIYFIYK